MRIAFPRGRSLLLTTPANRPKTVSLDSALTACVMLLIRPVWLSIARISSTSRPSHTVNRAETGAIPPGCVDFKHRRTGCWPLHCSHVGRTDGTATSRDGGPPRARGCAQPPARTRRTHRGLLHARLRRARHQATTTDTGLRLGINTASSHIGQYV